MDNQIGETMQKLHPVLQYGLRQSGAIKCLRLNEHKEATLILLYAAIDHMAWLSIDGEEAGNKGFKLWVEKYMLARSANMLAGATSADLWGARCGILHTAAPESNEFLNGNAKRVYYSSNLGQVASQEKDVIVLSLEALGTAFAVALVYFIEELEANPTQDANARAKLGRMLVHRAM